MDALSRRMAIVSEKPTIIFGDDVTHPSPRADSSPSITARFGLGVTPSRQELIQDLYSLVEDPQKGTSHARMIRNITWLLPGNLFTLLASRNHLSSISLENQLLGWLQLEALVKRSGL
ncbi:hypothetical protein IFM89_009188 [Coptis chinensis]|uniref:Piwi domain-containing protein n=1 Tax=Coptis chinensis TaxID=261450 RepID=A0A835M9I2_9MAGN|nr:hypothetical protein IFM89_009188 [Coptis chinensis]